MKTGKIVLIGYFLAFNQSVCIIFLIQHQQQQQKTYVLSSLIASTIFIQTEPKLPRLLTESRVKTRIWYWHSNSSLPTISDPVVTH